MIPPPPPPPISPPITPPSVASSAPVSSNPLPPLQPEPDSLSQVQKPIPPPPASADEDTPNIKSSIFKKLIPILGIFAGLVLVILLVTKVILPRLKGSNEPELVNLTYWGLWEATPVLTAVITDYQSQNPHVTINYQQQSHKDYRERLQSSLARGDGPDIFRFHNTWVPMLKSELAPLPASIYDPATFQNTFFPVAQKDLNLGANLVGIPLMYDGLALLYNQDLFSAGGKSPPQNWEELRQTAFDLTVKDESGKIQTAGIALGTTSNVEHWSDILGLMMLQNGANPATPSDSAAADALRFYTIFSLSDRVWDNTLPNSIYAFATEKVAMIFAPSWQIHSLLEINPQLNFGVLPVPQLPGTQVSWASYWVEGVSQKSTKQEEAFKFVKYLSEKNTLVKFYTEAAKTRKFGEPYSRKDLAEVLQKDQILNSYISQAPQAQSFYMASRTFDNGLNDKIIKYYEDTVNAVNQGQDPEDALQTTAQGVAQILSQYGITSK